MMPFIHLTIDEELIMHAGFHFSKPSFSKPSAAYQGTFWLSNAAVVVPASMRLHAWVMGNTYNIRQ